MKKWKWGKEKKEAQERPSLLSSEKTGQETSRIVWCLQLSVSRGRDNYEKAREREKCRPETVKNLAWEGIKDTTRNGWKILMIMMKNKDSGVTRFDRFLLSSSSPTTTRILSVCLVSALMMIIITLMPLEDSLSFTQDYYAFKWKRRWRERQRGEEYKSLRDLLPSFLLS